MIFEPIDIEISKLSCERDDRLLFKKFINDAQFRTNSAVAGPNGAGKTTLLRTIAGLFDIQTGTIRMNQLPLNACLEQILYIGHKPQVTKDLTVLNNLNF